jgi:hypothetical protein
MRAMPTSLPPRPVTPHQLASDTTIDTLPDEPAVITAEDPRSGSLKTGPDTLPLRRSWDDEPTRKAHAPRRPRAAVEETGDDDKWSSSSSRPKPKL